MSSYRINCDATGDSYCLNGGSCLVDVPKQEATPGQQHSSTSSSSEPCMCNPGFTGAHCQIELSIDKSPCTLNCQNGGRCESLDPSLQADQPKLPWPLSNKNDDDAAAATALARGDMHCVCPTGFSGYNCEYEADICGNFEHICLHGSKCSTLLPESSTPTHYNKGEILGGVVDASFSTTVSYECTCPQGKKGCQKPHQIEYCAPQADTGAIEYHGGMAVPAFCVNGGKCRDVLSEDGRKWHAGCDCSPFFEGPRCEFIKSQAELLRLVEEKSYSGSAKDGATGWIIILAMCAILALGTLIVSRKMVRVVRFFRRHPGCASGRQFRHPDENDDDEDEMNLHHEGFRDEIAEPISQTKNLRHHIRFSNNNAYAVTDVGDVSNDEFPELFNASCLADVSLTND